MVFVLSNVLKTLFKNKKISVIIIVALFVAYLFFFLGCCYVEDGFRDLQSFKLTEMDNSIYYESRSLSSVPVSNDDFDSFFKQYSFINNFTTIEKYYFVNPNNGDSFLYYLISENYSRFFLYDVIDGRFFTQEEMESGAKVCVVEKTFMDTEDAKLGDIIVVGDMQLEIIGVIKRNADAGTVFIPENAVESRKLDSQSFQGYIVAATLTDLGQMYNIRWDELNLFGEILSAKDYFNNGLVLLLSRSAVIIVICIVILFYALLNLINIMKSKLEYQIKSFGIRMALGASYRQIFLQFFFECLILILIAICFVFVTEPIIGYAVKSIINHYFGLFSFATMLLASVASSYFISRALLKRLKKLNVVEIIKNL